jgi:hypothetical protein
MGVRKVFSSTLTLSLPHRRGRGFKVEFSRPLFKTHKTLPKLYIASAACHSAKRIYPFSPERLFLRHNATFSLEKSSSPKVALKSQASRNAVSYIPLSAVQSAIRFLQNRLLCKHLLQKRLLCKPLLKQRQRPYKR